MENILKSKVTYYIIGSFLLGMLVMSFFFPKRIAKLKNGEEVVVKYENGELSANELFDELKKYSAINLILNKVDTEILTDIYEVDENMTTEIQAQADEYIAYYEENGYSKEEFLTQSGFKSYEDFVEVIKVEYLQNKYYIDSLKENITEEEINEFYKNDVFGDISTKYIAVPSSESDAKDIANKILKMLKDGKSFDEAVKKYSDSVESENLNYISFDSNLDSDYLKSLRKLKDGKYTTSYVETEYGYTIIFRDASKEKSTLEDVKNRIIEYMVSEIQANDTEQTGVPKALIELRDKYKIEFYDTEFKLKYDEFKEEYK